MTEEARHVFFFSEKGRPEKYVPGYDKTRSVPARSYWDVGYGRGEPVDMAGKRLVFTTPTVQTEKEEKKLRAYDLICGQPGSFLFANDRLLDALSHLIDKDIHVLPATIDTPNGIVDGYHLFEVYNAVSGIDAERSWYSWQSAGGKTVHGPLSEVSKYGIHKSHLMFHMYKFIPKDTDFMEGHALAVEKELGGMYIIPSLREKLIKGKFKGIWMPSAKERHEVFFNKDRVPY